MNSLSGEQYSILFITSADFPPIMFELFSYAVGVGLQGNSFSVRTATGVNNLITILGTLVHTNHSETRLYLKRVNRLSNLHEILGLRKRDFLFWTCFSQPRTWNRPTAV